MPDLENTVLPPPPPPTVSFSDVEKIEALVESLSKQMHETNVRRRFKMCVYEDWCGKIDAIHAELRKLRGAS
jgi:hypothetical protein